MGKDHSVCRKVVTDTGCVYWWSHSCVRCISVHESQRLVETDPQFNLENVSEYSFFLKYEAVSTAWSLLVDCWRFTNRHGDTLRETWIVINADEIISYLNGRNLHFFVEFAINKVTTDNILIFVLLTSETYLCSYKRWFVFKFAFLKEIKIIEIKQ